MAQMDSLKSGWRGSEFWLALAVVTLGGVAVYKGYAWAGMGGASVASLGYGLARGLSKASFAQRGGSASRVV
jgi:hypothetical protein